MYVILIRLFVGIAVCLSGCVTMLAHATRRYRTLADILTLFLETVNNKPPTSTRNGSDFSSHEKDISEVIEDR